MQSRYQLFGRLLALDKLQDEVFNEIHPNFSPVILVHGISGVGKTALCEHFLKLVRQQLIGVGEVIIIPYKGVPQSSSTLAFSRLLLEAIKRSRSQPLNRSRLYDSSQSCDFDLNDSIVNPTASERYSEDGAAYSDALSAEHLSAAAEIELAQELGYQLAHLIEDDFFMLGANARPRIVFYFDEFSRYPENIKRWIGGGLYQACELLKQSAAIAGSVYIQTGRFAWDKGDEADNWQVHPAALRHIELSRLTYSDCQQWLSELGHTDRDLVDVLYEDTEGVPARIVAVLAQENFPSTLSTSRALERADTLSQYSAKQRRWLHAAAMQPRCSREALQILIGKGEAQDAFNWLQQDSQLTDKDNKSVKSTDEWNIRLDPKLREEILMQAKKRKPLCHAGYMEKIELLQAINKKVPSRRHRELLSQLSPIQPFSDKVLNEVFGR